MHRVCTVCAPCVHRWPFRKVVYLHCSGVCTVRAQSGGPFLTKTLLLTLQNSSVHRPCSICWPIPYQKPYINTVEQECPPPQLPQPSQPEGKQYLASGRLEAGLGQVCVKAIIEIQTYIFWKSRFEKLRFS